MLGNIPIHVQGASNPQEAELEQWVTTDRHHQIVEGENKYPKMWGAPLGTQNSKCQMAK